MFRGGGKNYKLVVIPNKYKENLDDLIDSSDSVSPDRAAPIHGRSRNAPRSECRTTSFLEKNCSDKNIADSLSLLASKLEICRYVNTVLLDLEQDMGRVGREKKIIREII